MRMPEIQDDREHLFRTFLRKILFVMLKVTLLFRTEIENRKSQKAR